MAAGSESSADEGRRVSLKFSTSVEGSTTAGEDILLDDLNRKRTMPTTNPFATNITRLAGMHGLTPSQLAKVLGVTPQSVSLWRSGREPSTNVAMKASHVFELPAEKLFSTSSTN